MKEFEKKLYAYLKARNWHQLRPADLAKSVMIEGAELLELFQWENQTLNEVKANKEKMEEIKKELADVLIYATELSILLGFDTEKIMRSKLAAAEKKYPAKLMKSNPGKEPGTDTIYWKIKKEHRARSK